MFCRSQFKLHFWFQINSYVIEWLKDSDTLSGGGWEGDHSIITAPPQTSHCTRRAEAERGVSSPFSVVNVWYWGFRPLPWFVVIVWQCLCPRGYQDRLRVWQLITSNGSPGASDGIEGAEEGQRGRQSQILANIINYRHIHHWAAQR